MRAAGFFLKTAFTQLRRGGQRNLVAFLCVAFGVMSLVMSVYFAAYVAWVFRLLRCREQYDA